ncbi:DotI/IcmL family type IV secretion protein [Parachitinimonas caeni]|uniref:DotI/IcmL family type IV secretion protein n=1 Tax=Parachitinimonas caeni TaxID=3031301 RepID=A0ABT7DZB9_9NEIS|nr:DotI/IcmL family type IV secretion protein [Parachitinimonas caeni]MDK2124418.1 DotI/IcmL family type IV secretion protein [Parachitinimonas caeni]
MAKSAANAAEAAAYGLVLQDNARLHDEVSRLKLQLLRLVIGLLVTICLLLTLVWAFFWGFPKYRYIHVKDANAVCVAQALDQPNVDVAAVAQFATDAAVGSFTFDYRNYRPILTAAMDKYYSADGRTAFLNSLEESGNLDRVIKNRLIVSSVAIAPSQVAKQGVRNGIYYWEVQTPLKILYSVGGQQENGQLQRVLFVSTVIREPTNAINPKGIAVHKTVVAPLPSGWGVVE